jgi:hypothetical protein
VARCATGVVDAADERGVVMVLTDQCQGTLQALKGLWHTGVNNIIQWQQTLLLRPFSSLYFSGEALAQRGREALLCGRWA